MKGYEKKLFVIFSILIFLIGCSKQKIDSHLISVSILPQKYFVKKIAGDAYKVNVIIPPGQSPATYDPTVKQMKQLTKSSLYFRIGHIPFEKAHINNIKSVNTSMKIIDTSKGINLIKGSYEHKHKNSVNEGNQDNKGIDPHVWLSSHAAKVMSKNIMNALCSSYPDQCTVFKKNYESLMYDINNLDIKIKKILKNSKSKKFIAFHPAWTYFSRDYNLIQVPIEVNGKNPSPVQIKKLIDTARKENIRVIFVQKQFPSDNAEAIARDIKGKVVYLDPLDPDWPENMEKIAEAFKKELK